MIEKAGTAANYDLSLINSDFGRITYTDAIKELEKIVEIGDIITFASNDMDYKDLMALFDSILVVKEKKIDGPSPKK